MKARYLVQLPTADEHRRWVGQRLREIAAAEQCRKRKAKR